MSRVLAITGMHRSGTSAISGYLQKCGLDIGTRLIGPTYGNLMGHFEDAEIECIQEGILSDNDIVLNLSSDTKLTLNSNHKAQLKRVISDRAIKPVWAWKDPRTSLFLKEWKAELPELKVLGLYRHWADVLYSLVSRDRKQQASLPKSIIVPLWHSRSNTWLMNQYLKTWIRYNSDLLEFAKTFPKDIVFVNIRSLHDQKLDKQLFTHLNQNWNLDLQHIPFGDSYKESAFRAASEKWKKTTDKVLASHADVLFKQLNILNTWSKKALL
ncbi:MAG: hypothetical protein ACI959_002142 [Limisphaerales bacterium]|jgi:hypothetical protein